MVPVATLLGAQLYKASTGFSFPNIYSTTNITLLTNKSEKNSPIIIIVDCMEDHAVMLNTFSSLSIEIIIIIIIVSYC